VPEQTNRLIHESSPYLRQHAHNPVDWYPWCDEAFSRAKTENKPVLLSVGYSACHWCHVMEHESFENPETAELMNDLFVNIKVDREERPDLDHIYMTAVQMLTGHGGWPMTMFLTPAGEPFYGGTYFPPEDRHGLPGFRRLLVGVSQAYHDKPADVRNTIEQLVGAMRKADASSSAAALPDGHLVLQAAAAMSNAYDERYGGIGQAPKFPNTSVLELFLRASHCSGEARYQEMALYTLRRMAEGGIYDQLGGGFHRYSVDQHWLVPHFEKMLYDNAQLVPLYLAAFQLTQEPLFSSIARDTLDYVVREMRDPHGGFYSTQDADSEGEEGKFFVWDRHEVESLLGDDAEIVCRYWDVSDVGNFEQRNILHVTLDIEQLSGLFRRSSEDVRRVIADARAKLFAAREERIKPGRDEKILTSWNGLMISAFAKAAEVFGDDNYRQVAVDAVAFLQRELQRGDRLLSTYKDGVAKLNGCLDDYAFFAAALVDVYEAVQDRSYLDASIQLVESMIAHFWDDSASGFFFTSDDHEALLLRTKPTFDGSIPAGNSIALQTLLRLHHYTTRTEYLERAEAMLRLYDEPMRRQPFGVANTLSALDFYTRGPREIVVVATPSQAGDLLAKIRRTFVPNRTLTVIEPHTTEQLPPPLTGKGQVEGKATVFICHNRACSLPAVTWPEVERLLH